MSETVKSLAEKFKISEDEVIRLLEAKVESRNKRAKKIIKRCDGCRIIHYSDNKKIYDTQISDYIHSLRAIELIIKNKERVFSTRTKRDSTQEFLSKWIWHHYADLLKNKTVDELIEIADGLPLKNPTYYHKTSTAARASRESKDAA